MYGDSKRTIRIQVPFEMYKFLMDYREGNIAGNTREFIQKEMDRIESLKKKKGKAKANPDSLDNL